MKAIVYTQYGPPEVLKLKEIDKPVPKDKEVLIKLKAVEVTKSDCEMRAFKFPVNWFWLPLRIALGVFKPKRPVLGSYFAGEVVAKGKEVTRYQLGEQIFGCGGLRLGAYGEYMCLPERYTMVTKPSNMSFEEAAAVPLGGLNALHFMRRADIKPGEKVLVNGAGGSIGIFGVQIAKFMGAEVTAVDSGIKEEMLRATGADHFVNYQQQDIAQLPEKYNVILDMVASSSYKGCMGLLEPEGRYLLGNPRLSDMLRSSWTSKFTDKNVIFAFARETEEELLALKEMIEAGQIRAVVDKIYTMDQAPEAHHRVETEQRLGSIVISIDD
ncbi:MAG: NAD(P)-dependent alcohol dehydrogenase [Cyclobacteriaceae bacterium]|nr:NAD(P)-dependent alcohol dehydrogenase [Cyclobacteriaceae bacterium]